MVELHWEVGEVVLGGWPVAEVEGLVCVERWFCSRGASCGVDACSPSATCCQGPTQCTQTRHAEFYH